MISTSHEQTVIPLSRKRIILIFLGSIAFVALGFALIGMGNDPSYRMALQARLAGVASIVFFGLCALFALRKLVDSAPGLIIDSKGLVDNSSALAVGRIYWSDIERLSVAKVYNQRLLAIVVKNPSKYVQKGSFFKQRMNAVNLRYFGSPIQISSVALQADFDDLVRIIERGHERSKELLQFGSPPASHGVSACVLADSVSSKGSCRFWIVSLFLVFSLVGSWVAFPRFRETVQHMKAELGIPLLCDSAKKSHNYRLRALLFLGIPVYFSDRALKQFPNYVETCSPVWSAASVGNAEGLKTLLENGGIRLVNRVEFSSGSPLGVALQRNHLECVRILREAGAKELILPLRAEVENRS